MIDERKNHLRFSSEENMSTPTDEIVEKKESLLEICKTWFLNSPTHGIRRISRANSTAGRLFWSFIFLICTTLMAVFICTVIMKFIAHPTKISLIVRPYRDVDHIPTVTFCKRKSSSLICSWKRSFEHFR